MVDRIRLEEENIKYEYYYPKDDIETVLLIDEWKDQSALDKHHNSDIMKEIVLLREKYKLSMQVEKYVCDVSDFSAKDAKYIAKK